MFSLGLVVLCCANLQEPSGMNGSEVIKDEEIKALRKQNFYDKWIIKFLENALDYNQD